MYLGMSEEDYQNVQNETPKLVAKRLWITTDYPAKNWIMPLKPRTKSLF